MWTAVALEAEKALKIIRNYTVFSILKVGFATAALAALIMLGADLFSKLDTYVSNSVTGSGIFIMTLLHFPKSLIMVMGPAFLFSVTYFLSMLHARNELICLLNSGVSYFRIIAVCLITCLGVSFFSFGLSETVALRCENKRNLMYENATNTSSVNANSSAIALSDMYSGYSVYAAQYFDYSQTLIRVVLIENMDDGQFTRTDASTATWEEEKECWLLKDATVYTIVNETVVSVESHDSLLKERFTIKPRLFRNSSADIETMDLISALDYASSMKAVNSDKYNSLSTTIYKRLFENLMPLVFAVIACSMNYRYKKNILFLSIVSSVAVAVIYYVCLLVSSLMADQGIIAPYMGSVFPLMVILVLSALIYIFTTRKK